jgi:hypothetical protein
MVYCLMFGLDVIQIRELESLFADRLHMTDIGYCDHYLGIDLHQEEKGEVM